MVVYLTLLLAGAAPQPEPEIVRDIHARPGSVWQATEGLVDDRPPPLGYRLDHNDAKVVASPSLAYDLTGMGRWDRAGEDPAERAFEEAIDMARDAREDISAQTEFRQPD